MKKTDATEASLEAAREKVRHTAARLDEIRADLEAAAAELRLPEQGEDLDGPLAGLCEVDAVIRCGVHDHLRPLIRSLQGLAAGEAEAGEEAQDVP